MVLEMSLKMSRAYLISFYSFLFLDGNKDIGGLFLGIRTTFRRKILTRSNQVRSEIMSKI